jgi:hypothetical protein
MSRPWISLRTVWLFLLSVYRTNVADLRTMAKNLWDLGWVKEDYSDQVDKYVDFALLSRAAEHSPAQFPAW